MLNKIDLFNAKNAGTPIEKGMVITVEPGIYLEGDFGVRLEDTVAIDNKAHVIGDLPLNVSNCF